MTRATELERAVAELLRIKRIPFVRVSNYRCHRCGQVGNSSAKGFPDFLCLCPWLALEMKTGKGRLSPEQMEFRKHCERGGIPFIVVRDNLDELIKYLDRGEWRQE